MRRYLWAGELYADWIKGRGAYGVLDVAFLLGPEGAIRLALVEGDDETGELAVDEAGRGVEGEAQGEEDNEAH